MLLKLRGNPGIYQTITDKIAGVFKIPIYSSVLNFEKVYHSFPRPEENFKFFTTSSLFIKVNETKIEKENFNGITLLSILSSDQEVFWVEKNYFEEA